MTGNNIVPPPTGTPQVITWFRVYAGLLAVVGLLIMAISILFFVIDPSQLENTNSEDLSVIELRLIGGMYFILGLAPFIMPVVGLLAPPRPWVWTYNLVIICMGIPICCCMPICIPLLIFWLEPRTKEYFGRL